MSFSGLLPDSITIEPYIGADGYGAAQFGSAVTYKARLRGGAADVKTAAGEEVVSKIQIYLNTITPIDTRSRITLPARFSPTNPPIIGVEPVTGLQSTHHVKIYV
jgi:hypothetical protein